MVRSLETKIEKYGKENLVEVCSGTILYKLYRCSAGLLHSIHGLHEVLVRMHNERQATQGPALTPACITLHGAGSSPLSITRGFWAQLL